MKKAKRLTSLVLTGAMLAGVLGMAACGGGGSEGDGKITYYMWGSRKEVETAQQLAADFKLLHPEWTVEVQPSTGNYYDNLKTNFGGGNAPDLFFMEGGMIESFIRDGMLLDLDSYVENGEFFKAEDMWGVNDCYRYNAETNRMGSGKLYAIIKDLTPDFMMIYNKKHIDDYDEDHAVPLAEEVGYPTDESGKYPSPDVAMTWAQCTEMCKLLTVTDAQGNITRYGTTLDQVPWKHVMEWIQMGGDTLFTADMKNFNKDSQAVYDAFEYFVNFQYGETKSAAAVASGSVGGGESFKNGDVSVNWNGRWAFQSYGWYDVNFEIGVAPPPTPNGGTETYCATTMISHAINAASPDKDVAYAFLEYYMTVGMNAYVETGYNIPGNKTIAYNQFLNVSDPYDTQNGTKEEKDVQPIEDNGTYVFAYDGIRLQKLTAPLKAVVWATDETTGKKVVVATKEKTVQSYLEELLTKSAVELGLTDEQYAKMQTLAVDILNCGAASQEYRNFDTEKLANANLTDGQKALATQYVAPAVTYREINSTEDITFMGARLWLDYKVGLCVAFRLSENVSIENLSITAQVEGKEPVAFTYVLGGQDVILLNEANRQYQINFGGIMATEFDKKVTFTLSAEVNGEQSVATLEYSVATCIASRVAQSGEDLALVKAIYCYGLSAQAYETAMKTV